MIFVFHCVLAAEAAFTTGCMKCICQVKSCTLYSISANKIFHHRKNWYKLNKYLAQLLFSGYGMLLQLKHFTTCIFLTREAEVATIIH